MAKVEIIELLIDETKEEMGINAVSVVESPAIEENFVALQKHEVELKEVDTEKRILMGAALIPNKQIYRKNKDKEFYIYFSENTVRKASELFLMRSNQNNATYEHERKMLEGMSVVESWIIEDEKTDKSKLYGFSLPKGTWMISMKVNNDEVWQKVKDGEVKGFSIEGYFVDKYDMSKNINEMDTIEKLKELIIKHENKTKLGAHKIDLALVDELKKVNENILNTLKNADNSWRAYQDYLTRADAPFKKMMQMRESLLNSTGKIELLLKNAETQAKNLGLNVNDIPLYSVIKSNLNKKNEIIGTIDSFKDPSTFQ
jgi:phage head maturation protease